MLSRPKLSWAWCSILLGAAAVGSALAGDPVGPPIAVLFGDGFDETGDTSCWPNAVP